jgi:CheY-like chemotaxis protein
MMINVLMVDDDEDDREVFVTAVKSLNTPVQHYVAKDGNEALHMLQNEMLVAPDFIFLDLNMPRMSGLECLREIKNRPGLKSIPVVMYTTSKSETDINNSFKSGATGFVCKPNKFEDLQKILIAIFSTAGSLVKEKLVFNEC